MVTYKDAGAQRLPRDGLRRAPVYGMDRFCVTWVVDVVSE